MNYTDLEKLSINPDFIRVVKVAIMKAANDISFEPLIDGELDKYNRRKSLAMTVLSNPEAQSRLFSLHCASIGILTEAYSDSDIQCTVNSIWDARAGVLNYAV